MSWQEWGSILNWAAIIVGAIVAVYNYRSGATRNEFLNRLSSTDTIQKLNETLDLAVTSNLKYEKQRKSDRDEIFLLEKRLAALESNLQYRLTFDVILGTEPTIEKAVIHHLVERRETEIDVPKDRRRKS